MPAQGHFSEARPLVDDENYNAEPSWSPDSHWISYETIFRGGSDGSVQLFKRNIYTGETFPLSPLYGEHGPTPGDSTSWSTDGRIAFEMYGDIYQVGERGGEVTKLLDVKSQYRSIEPSMIRWSPDGSKLCFVAKVWPKPRETNIWLYDFKSREMRTLKQADFPQWLDNDHILFSRPISDHESRILIFSVEHGSTLTITKGHLDWSPTANPDGSRIFFARGLPHQPVTTLNPMQGFHIWTISHRAHRNQKARGEERGQPELR